MATKKKTLLLNDKKLRSIHRLRQMIPKNEFTIQALLQEDVDINAKGPDGYTFLLLAGFYGHENIIEMLLDSGANSDCCNDDGFTLLHILIKWPDILQSVVKRVRDLDARNKDCYTALHLAVLKNIPDAVKYLVEAGADVNARINGGMTPLLIASSKGNVDVVNMLLNKEACVCDRKECAVWYRSYRRKACDVDASDEDGLTALHLASLRGHKEVVKCLLEKGADTNAKNKLGDTALITACKKSRSDVIKSLVEANARCDIRNNRGNGPLHHLILPLKPRRNVDEFKLMMRNGAISL